MSRVEQKLLTLHTSSEFHPSFSGVHVVRPLAFCVVFCKSWFVPLLFFAWPLCCLSFDLRYLQIILTYMLFHVILTFGITATSQSATSYTAIYTGVGSVVVTALMSVIIVMAPLRNDVIILTFIILPLYNTRY